MRALLEAGGDAREVTQPGDSLLSIAASLSRVEVVRLLLAAGADPNQVRGDCYTILIQAAGTLTYHPDANFPERLAMIRLLIDAGADVNASAGRWGMTPLAATRGEYDLVRTLLEAGATLPTDRPGHDPLLVAVMEGRGKRRNLARIILTVTDFGGGRSVW